MDVLPRHAPRRCRLGVGAISTTWTVPFHDGDAKITCDGACPAAMWLQRRRAVTAVASPDTTPCQQGRPSRSQPVSPAATRRRRRRIRRRLRRRCRRIERRTGGGGASSITLPSGLLDRRRWWRRRTHVPLLQPHRRPAVAVSVMPQAPTHRHCRRGGTLSAGGAAGIGVAWYQPGDGGAGNGWSPAEAGGGPLRWWWRRRVLRPGWRWRISWADGSVTRRRSHRSPRPVTGTGHHQTRLPRRLGRPPQRPVRRLAW